MSLSKELFQIARQLDKYAEYETAELDRLMEAVESVEKSWSGSWLSSELDYYNKNFEPTSEVYGKKTENEGYRGLYYGPPPAEWRTHRLSEVERHINEKSDNPSTDRFSEEGKDAITAFKKAKSSVLSFIYEKFDSENDRFFQSWIGMIEELEFFSESEFIESQRLLNEKTTIERFASKNNRRSFSRSGNKSNVFAALAAMSHASNRGAIKVDIETPPHVVVLAKILAIKHPFDSCKALYERIVELGKHLQNIERTLFNEGGYGTRVFIGHGRSHCWRDLKDFISGRLKLVCDEFNRVVTAGYTIPERLKEMLEQASIAFLVMTAEDEQVDGKLHARMNVIHEVGLFQGKLGFRKAIILLEEGCEKFSNIHGLVEIRFPKGDIRAVFEEIREVMEREGVLD